MMKFKNYFLVKEQANTQALDQAKSQFMQAFQGEFQKDAQTALTWLNNLYTKVLPGDYKNFYSQYNQQKSNQPQQQQPQQQQPQQQQQPPQQ